MKSITRLIAFAVATTALSGCSTMESIVSIPKTLIADPFMAGFDKNGTSGYKQGNFDLGSKEQANTVHLDCNDGNAIYDADLKKNMQISMTMKDDVLIGSNIDGGTYYMHPDVMLFIEQKTVLKKPRTNIFVLEENAKTDDGFSLAGVYNTNKTLYDRICGVEKLTKIPKQSVVARLSAIRVLTYAVNGKHDNTGANILSQGEDYGQRDYQTFPEYQAVLKKHIPGYTDDKVHVADPVAVLTYFAKNKDKLTALNADLEVYFNGQYITTIEDYQAKQADKSLNNKRK